MRYFKPRKNLEYSNILRPQRIEKYDFGHDKLFVYRRQNGDIAKWHENGVVLPSTIDRKEIIFNYG